MCLLGKWSKWRGGPSTLRKFGNMEDAWMQNDAIYFCIYWNDVEEFFNCLGCTAYTCMYSILYKCTVYDKCLNNLSASGKERERGGEGGGGGGGFADPYWILIRNILGCAPSRDLDNINFCYVFIFICCQPSIRLRCS